ncbi:hypothetical protein [Paenibacillus typhae]|uniref:hypothetical protein n=1 Tax=Paenibacillus typhae TaxID=1174501 RepID=UPI001C8DA8EC|nr:hypothetical protein [Paenibacillus typhae]
MMKELNKQFRTYCIRNNEGEFVGKSAESNKKKLDELQEALPNNAIVVAVKRVKGTT